MKQSGFTLLELLIVMAILGIIAGSVISAISNHGDKVERVEELHIRWINICVEDTRLANPMVSSQGARERCEIKWQTEVLPGLDKKPGTQLVPMPIVISG